MINDVLFEANLDRIKNNKLKIIEQSNLKKLK
jgi:hypothetical protein